MRERNFFHRPSAQTVREPRVVNDLASTDVDAVMQIAAPGSNKVRTQRGFLIPDQYPVASETHGAVIAKCRCSQRASDRGVGCALAHAVIERLRLCIGRNAEEARQQLAAAPVGQQRLAVISELVMAEHQSPIQTLVERVEFESGSIQVRGILPSVRVFALTRRIADGAQQTIA
jgi:hypothetical protein